MTTRRVIQKTPNITRIPGKDGGKGDTYRRVDLNKYADNWDLVFGKKKDESIPTE